MSMILTKIKKLASQHTHAPRSLFTFILSRRHSFLYELSEICFIRYPTTATSNYYYFMKYAGVIEQPTCMLLLFVCSTTMYRQKKKKKRKNVVHKSQV